MHPYLGDFGFGQTVRIWINTSDLGAAPITLDDTPSVTVYKNGGTTEDATGVTLDVDFDSVVGLHYVEVDMSADPTFFARASDFVAVLAAGEVDSIPVIGKALAQWSVEHRSMHREMADSIAAVGDIPTPVQALLMMTRFLLTEREFLSGTLTIFKEDGTTPSMTFTANSPTAPSTYTRAT